MKSQIRKYLHSHKSKLQLGQICIISFGHERQFIQIDYVGILLISYFEL
jgi:hypothetical protein